MKPRVYFVGTAGAGKSTLVKSFKEWMENQSYDCITLNLDPGAEYLPYTPDVDIRENISLESVMDQYNLGPNGAQIVAADLMVQESRRIAEIIDSYDSDYVLVDVPGQLELFAFRQSSKQFIEDLGKDYGAMIYLLDSALAQNPYSYISSKFLALSVMTRFYIPFFPVISKSDLIDNLQRSMIEKWEKNKEELMDSLRALPASIDVQFSEQLIKGMSVMDTLGPSTFVSSESTEGLEDIYAYLQRLFYASDDLEKR